MAKLRNIWMTSSNLKLLRALPALGAMCLLGGCTPSLGTGDFGALIGIAKYAWSGSQKVTLEEAASVPYASMGIRIGDASENMIILASESNGQRLWTSSARVAISTKDDGRIVRTAGLTYNLGGYEAKGSTQSENGLRVVRWQADFPDLGLYSVSITCKDQQAGDETINILGKDIHTQRVNESCTSAGGNLDWSFENVYWIDGSSGLVWRSIQHVHPKLAAVESEILRPPG